MKQLVRRLRRCQTEAEIRLWRYLRDRRLAGCKFRRQHPVGPYVTDFACIEKRVVVEVDGGQHAERGRRDARRSEFLASRGFTVLRFWNDDVLRDTDVVLNEILKVLEAPSSPTLLPRGEGRLSPSDHGGRGTRSPSSAHGRGQG